MTVSIVPPGTYSVRLRAFDEWGNGPLSNQITCAARGACMESFCMINMRCTHSGYGTGCNGCCNYTCVSDPGCAVPDPCPANTCSSVCTPGGGF
jgi:hypothetical protein